MRKCYDLLISGTDARELIESGFDLYVGNEKSYSLLHVALEKGNLEAVKLFFEIINLSDKKDDFLNLKIGYRERTPLHIAILSNNIELIQLLIKEGADPNTRNRNRKFPLHLAIDIGSLEIIQILMDAGAKWDIKDKNGAPLVHYLAGRGTKEIFDLFSEREINIDLLKKDKNQNLPIHWSVRNGIEMVKRFTTKGTVNARNKYKQIPLHVAIKTQDLEVIQFLMNQGSSKDARDNKRQGFMHYIARWGNQGNI